MDKIRLCHMADFHLGSRLGGTNQLIEQVNRNLIRSLDEIFKVLKTSRVDLVLIAGDFYESSNQDFALLKNIKEILGNFPGKIVISPGNHDYSSIESAYRGQWPDNVYIFENEDIDYFEFKELNTRVYGFAFKHSHIYDRKLKALSNMKIDEDFINLGVFHGQLDDRLNAYNPIFKEDIANSGLDYIALGHIHKTSPIEKLGSTYYAYSGNPIGRGFHEVGKKGIYLGEISKERNSLSFFPVSKSEFHSAIIEVEDFSSQAIIGDQIRDFLKENFDSYKNHSYRIHIIGSIEEHENLNLDLLREQLSDINYLELIDNTRIKIDYKKFANDNSLKGIFVNNVMNQDLSEFDKQAILDIGFKAFEDKLWLKRFI